MNYQGKPVTVIRPAKNDDVGYNQDLDQVLVEFADKTTKLVVQSELTPEAPKPEKPEAPKPIEKPVIHTPAPKAKAHHAHR